MRLFDRISKEDHQREILAKDRAIKELEDQLADAVTEKFLTELRNHCPVVEQHSRRVADIVKDILKAKNGLKTETINRAYRTALLHDIGKLKFQYIAVQAGVIKEDASDVLIDHPKFGVDLIQDAIARWPALEKTISHNGILLHHERADGKGYPHGFRANEIDLDAKLIGVVDAFDHLIVVPEGTGMQMVDALNDLLSKEDVYDAPVLFMLAEYVSRQVTSSDRTDIGGATLAVQLGLNKYVKETQKLIRSDAELNRLYSRLQTASSAEKQEILDSLSRRLATVLPLPLECGRNILLHLAGKTINEDIKRNNILLDDESYELRLEDYRTQLGDVARQANGLKHHVEIVLDINNMASVQRMPIVGYNATGKTELWYCTPVDKETVLLSRIPK